MASNVIQGPNPQKALDFSGMSGGLFRSRTTEAKRARQDSSEDMNYVCGKCDKQIDEGIKCAGCKQLFCFDCAGVSKGLYGCLLKGELDDSDGIVSAVNLCFRPWIISLRFCKIYAHSMTLD